jgi:hypothetical protein
MPDHRGHTVSGPRDVQIAVRSSAAPKVIAPGTVVEAKAIITLLGKEHPGAALAPIIHPVTQAYGDRDRLSQAQAEGEGRIRWCTMRPPIPLWGGLLVVRRDLKETQTGIGGNPRREDPAAIASTDCLPPNLGADNRPKRPRLFHDHDGPRFPSLLSVDSLGDDLRLRDHHRFVSFETPRAIPVQPHAA